MKTCLIRLNLFAAVLQVKWVAAVAVLVGLLTSSHAAELFKVKLATDWYPQPEHGGFYYAQLKGFYKEEGLDVEIIPASPNSPVLPRVLSGRIDFGLSTADAVLFTLNQGLPLVAVGATMEHDPLGIMVHEESDVKSFADLEGKTVSVATGSYWMGYLQKRYGLKNIKERPLQFSVAPFVHDPNYISQCFVTSEPFYVKKAGSSSRTLLLTDSGYVPYRVFLTTQDFIKQHPDVVKGFVKASIRGWKEFMKDPQPVFKELMRLNPEMSPDKMEFSFNMLRDGRFIEGFEDKGEAAGLMVESRWKAQFEILKGLQLVKPDLDYHQAYTTNFYPTHP